MKKLKILFILALLSFPFVNVSAQYGYNNGYGGGFGGGRMSQLNTAQEQEKPKEIPAEVTVGKIMERLKPSLNLDALQEIAISNVLIESFKKQAVLIKSETSQEQKVEEFKVLSEITDRKIKDFLNEEQKEKYKVLNEENNSPKKSRKNR